MALPYHITNTYEVRQKRFLNLFDRGGRDARRTAGTGDCEICERHGGLHFVRRADGTAARIGPDCLEAYNGLNAANVEELRALVDPLHDFFKAISKDDPTGGGAASPGNPAEPDGG